MFVQEIIANYLFLSRCVVFIFQFISKATAKRREFILKTTELAKKLVKYLPIDSAVDQMAKRFIHESLPPCLTEAERERSIHGHGERWNEEKNRVEQIGEIEPDTGIKLIRRNCLRYSLLVLFTAVLLMLVFFHVISQKNPRKSVKFCKIS
jgi:hypothetical protein